MWACDIIKPEQLLFATHALSGHIWMRVRAHENSYGLRAYSFAYKFDSWRNSISDEAVALWFISTYRWFNLNLGSSKRLKNLKLKQLNVIKALKSNEPINFDKAKKVN